jgi:hypothetical protein
VLVAVDVESHGAAHDVEALDGLGVVVGPGDPGAGPGGEVADHGPIGVCEGVGEDDRAFPGERIVEHLASACLVGERQGHGNFL